LNQEILAKEHEKNMKEGFLRENVVDMESSLQAKTWSREKMLKTMRLGGGKMLLVLTDICACKAKK